MIKKPPSVYCYSLSQPLEQTGAQQRNIIDEIPMGSTDKTGNGSMTWGHPSCYRGKTGGQFLIELDRPDKCSRSCMVGLSGIRRDRSLKPPQDGGPETPPNL